MSEKIYELLEEHFIFGTVGDKKKGSVSPYTSVKIKPFLKDNEQLFQLAFTDGKQVFHKNLTVTEAAAEINQLLMADFHQAALFTEQHDYHITHYKSRKIKTAPPTKKNTAPVSHNREKTYLLKEGIPHDFLVYLGVMTADGRVVKAKYDKFRQINRYLEFVEEVLPKKVSDKPLDIIDFGCGKAYLTFALYYYLVKVKGFQVRITGLDIKEDVIRFCSKVAEELRYDGLSFQNGHIGDYTGGEGVFMVITLHACDNATDDAIAKAVSWGAKVILTVPCCQHEVAKKLPDSFLPVLNRHGILKERFSSLVTDALRAQLLESCGYKTTVMEFIDMEHTPKNILIKAIKKTPYQKESFEQYEQFRKELGIDFYLEDKLEKH